MTAVDTQLARAPGDVGELELALASAERETRALYVAAYVVLARPELATDEEHARACVVRDQFDAMFSGFLAIAAVDDDEAT